MQPPRVGATVAEARARLGWTRETLAFHSGLSWSAITQIESGRRADVRLSTLIALAEALGVSLDYLGGVQPAAIAEHQMLPFESTEGFAKTAAAMAAASLDRSHAVLVIGTPECTAIAREVLDDRSADVEFVDSAEWYESPSVALARGESYLNAKVQSGAPWIRVIGEPVFEGRTADEIAAWTRYESLLNIKMASAPATLVCGYNTRSLPESVVSDAYKTHPQVIEEGEPEPGPDFRPAEEFLL